MAFSTTDYGLFAAALGAYLFYTASDLAHEEALFLMEDQHYKIADFLDHDYHNSHKLEPFLRNAFLRSVHEGSFEPTKFNSLCWHMIRATYEVFPCPDVTYFRQWAHDKIEGRFRGRLHRGLRHREAVETPEQLNGFIERQVAYHMDALVTYQFR